MWTPEIIRARFVEAANTEKYLSAPRMPIANGYWPEMIYDHEDREGWDQAARDDHMAIWQGKGTAKAAALSRHQECLEWTAGFIDERRPLTCTMAHVLWDWARCRANGWDFGAKCVARGIARPTAYRRLTNIVGQITQRLNNDRVLLREPESKYLRQEEPSGVSIYGGLKNCASPHAIKFSKGYRTEKSRDLIQTPEDADTFSKFLERRNAKLRKLNSWRGERVA